ncbi:MAG: hypothetical protein GX804_01245, partial [Lentisphaerae bacterium]|nr:hypothetical protein [Lentisphaerota bacterium]
GHGGLEIIGSKKSIWDDKGLRIGGPDFPQQELAPLDDKPLQVARLIAVVKGELTDAEIDEDLEASRDAVHIMEAAYKSAQTGTWVDC